MVTIYLLIFILSLLVCLVSIYSEGLTGNINHMENGREPNAGVSLIGYIIFPLFFIGLAYIGNILLENLGWYAVFTLFGIIAVYALITIPWNIRKYNALIKKRKGS